MGSPVPTPPPSPSPRPDLTQQVLARCDALGFALSGVCDARPSDYEAELNDWLAQGKHGSMEWLAKDPAKRADPSQALPGARSIIMVADLYASRETAQSGNIAKYARGDDYHKVIKKRLHQLADDLRAEHPDAEFRAFVDTAPVLEREHAARAGLGWIGKHTLLIHPKFGSYLLLGGILTTLKLEPPASQRTSPDHCGTCTRCIDACPTDAITPRSVDATRCISYLTIEHREPIDESLRAPTADAGYLFGCDICQDVCPHPPHPPTPSPEQREPNPAYESRHDSFDILDLLGWTEDDRREAFFKSAMKRAKLPMLKRNALLLASRELINNDPPALRERVEEIARDDSEDPMVREAARWALDRGAKES